MDLIPGLVLLLGILFTIGLFGFDIFQHSKAITKTELNQSPRARQINMQRQIKTIFNRG